MPTVIVPSYAKLNLFLRVAGVRPDGYHEIETVFERVSLADTITLSSAKDSSIRIRCRTPGIPRDERNLCYRAAEALRAQCGINAGCEIGLVKRIPAGSGMGGGSSNAAATLGGLCRLWRLRISRRRLMGIAAGIGSDVPFFCLDARFALGTGRGEKVKAVAVRTRPLYHVILVPPVHVPTKEIYARWDSSRRAELTTFPADATMIFSALRRRDLRALSEALSNDLERVTGKAYPGINCAKEQLSQEPGVAGVLMTGSGSAVFGIFESKNAAVACARRLSRGAARVFFAETR